MAPSPSPSYSYSRYTTSFDTHHQRPSGYLATPLPTPPPAPLPDISGSTTPAVGDRAGMAVSDYKPTLYGVPCEDVDEYGSLGYTYEDSDREEDRRYSAPVAEPSWTRERERKSPSDDGRSDEKNGESLGKRKRAEVEECVCDGLSRFVYDPRNVCRRCEGERSS